MTSRVMVALALMLSLESGPSVGMAQTNAPQSGQSAGASRSLSGRAGPRRPPALVIDRVNVVDVRTGAVRAAQRAVIVGTRIQAIGPARTLTAPAGARHVDGRGKYLIPGLWDMHFHQQAAQIFYGKPRDPLVAHGLDSAALYGLDSAISHPLLIANGITGIRDPGSNIPLARLSQWKRAIAAGMHVGPRMLVAGPVVDGGYDGVQPDGRSVGASTPERMRRLVDSLHAAGADFIKTYGLTPRQYFVLAAEARRIGIPFGGHGPGAESAAARALAGGLTLSDSGAGILDHQTWLLGDPCGDLSLDSLKVEQCAAAGEHFRRHHTWVVAVPGALMAHGLIDFPRRYYELQRRYRPMPSALDSAGFRAQPNWARGYPTSGTDWIAPERVVDSLSGHLDPATGVVHWEMLHYMPILAGTDVSLGAGPPGFTLHDQLAVYVAKGMSPLAALQTATLNPALAWRATDSLGTVEAGKLADLVLLDANPLVDIWNTTKIRAVVANGRYFDRAALDQLLADAERAAHR